MLRNIIKRSFTTLIRAPKFPLYPYLVEYNAYDFNFKLGKYISKNDHIFSVELPSTEHPVLSEHSGFVIHNYMSPRLCKEVVVGEPLFTLSDNPFTEEDDMQSIYESYIKKVDNGEQLRRNDLHVFKYIANQMRTNDVIWNCGLALYKAKKYKEADKLLMMMDRKYPRLTFLKGLIKFKLEDYYSAMNFFDQSNDVDGQYGKTLLYAQLGIDKKLAQHILKNIGDIPEFEIKK